MPATQTQFRVEKITRSAAQQKLAITVLSGGPSGERDVSLESGRAVSKALESVGHRVYLEDISPDNLAALARQADCVFIALHGHFGEDGQVQEILERRRLAYTGSGPAACRLAMNKADAKREFERLGIPTPCYIMVSHRGAEAADDQINEFSASLRDPSLPLVVKPVVEGSSLHCYITRDDAQRDAAIEKVFEQYGTCLVEQYIPGREITVGILGDRALPPIEIRTRRDFYDFSAKYVDEDTKYDFDIPLPEGVLRRIQELSLAAHTALGCRDFSRLDWRVDEQCNPYLLELNVIPGLTSHSLLPKAAARAGIPMTALCQRLVDLSIQRRFQPLRGDR